MRVTMFALSLTLVGGVAACDAGDVGVPTSPEVTTPSAAVVAETADQSQGAIVVFDETVAFFIHHDARRGLMSLHGGLAEFCLGLPITTTPRQIVATPSEISQTLFRIGEDEQPVVIYRTDEPVVSCALANSPARVAAGTVRHDQTFTLGSFAARWEGEVTAPDGSTHHLTEVYQLTADVHDPNDPALWSLNTSKILLR